VRAGSGSGGSARSIAAFGGLALDLRTAQLSQDEITLTVWSLAARVSVRVSGGMAGEGIRCSPSADIARSRTNDADAKAPVIRLRGTSVGGSFDLSQG